MTLGAQALAAMTLALPSVLAPVAAAELAVPAQQVGWLVSAAYLAAMLSGLNGGWLAARSGPVRITQWALAACAGGLALLSAGVAPMLLIGAAAIGVGYGLTNPMAAEILSRHAPLARRGLFFSTKQAGVPFGVALAGLLLPLLLGVGVDWQGATLAVALLLAAAALAVGWSRGALDPATPPACATGADAPRSVRAPLLQPLREVLAFGPTRRLSLVSLAYALTQVGFLTFLVSMLNIEYGLSLALSAGLLSASQAVSVVARVGWGHVSDRWVDPTRLLGLLGLVMGASLALLGLAPVSTPWPVMLAVTMLCAATAVAWNGVFFADLVRHVPPARIAGATGATQFLTFLGSMSGSALFATLVSATGSYRTVYAALALLPIVAGALVLLATRRDAAAGSPDQRAASGLRSSARE